MSNDKRRGLDEAVSWENATLKRKAALEMNIYDTPYIYNSTEKSRIERRTGGEGRNKYR
jgi:hypothetical protein